MGLSGTQEGAFPEKHPKTALSEAPGLGDRPLVPAPASGVGLPGPEQLAAWTAGRLISKALVCPVRPFGDLAPRSLFTRVCRISI